MVYRLFGGARSNVGVIDNTLTPIAVKPRIQALDVIRGVSILGILAVNADGYAAPIAASLKPLTWPFPNVGATAIAYWIMDVFFHEKFLTLFSMLFGVSLLLVGGERNNKQKSRILWRRLAALFLFAMLHGFGIWWGDILSLYACTGLLMALCRSWRPRNLLLTGVVLYVTMACKAFPFAVLFQYHPPSAEVALHSPSASQTERIATTIAEARGSWAGAYHVNVQAYLHQLRGVPAQIPANLALMMVGLSLFKSGFLSAKSVTRTYALAFVVGLVSLGIEGWALWHRDILMHSISGDSFLEEVLSPLVSLMYASSLILLLRAGASHLLSPVASAGRMAFTNYLTQSILMTSIFYGGRGALMGTVNRVALWVLTLAVWVLQLVWSSWWLSRFEMGPFEWVWRCMTYGTWVRLRKPVPAPARV